MNVDLFLKNVPAVVKELIGREAFENRRSVNQEAIALLEEALVLRVGSHPARARTSLEALRAPTGGTAARVSGPAGAPGSESWEPREDSPSGVR